MTSETNRREDQETYAEASDWWSRMRGPDGDAHRAAFERWLAVPVHRAAYATLQEAWQASGGLGGTEFGRDRSLERHRSRVGPIAIGAAALTAAAAAAMVIVFPKPGTGGGPSRPTGTVALMESPVGQIRTLELPDGSKVTLDTDSQVRVRYASDARRLELVRGRARFDVRPDASRVFIVEAGNSQVAAPEGSFDTALVPDGVSLTAWRGALDVRDRKAAFTSAVLFRVEPGRAIVFRSVRIRPAPAPVAKGTERWVAGMLVFQSTPLADVLVSTNRYSRQRIELGDPSLGALRVTGTFRPLPVDALAASLAAAFDLRVRAVPTGSLVLERP